MQKDPDQETSKMRLYVKCIHWVVAEFRQNKIVQSPPEIDFNLGRQLQRKQGSLELHHLCFLLWSPGMKLTAILSRLITRVFYSIFTWD